MTNSKRQNSCTLNIGGAERTLVFDMETEELYLTEKKNAIQKGFDMENPITQNKLVFYCALAIGSSKSDENITIENVGKWIKECEDERLDEALDFADDAMGFILLVENRVAMNQQALRMKVLKKTQPKVYQEMMNLIEQEVEKERLSLTLS